MLPENRRPPPLLGTHVPAATKEHPELAAPWELAPLCPGVTACFGALSNPTLGEQPDRHPLISHPKTSRGASGAGAESCRAPHSPGGRSRARHPQLPPSHPGACPAQGSATRHSSATAAAAGCKRRDSRQEVPTLLCLLRKHLSGFEGCKC